MYLLLIKAKLSPLSTKSVARELNFLYATLESKPQDPVCVLDTFANTCLVYGGVTERACPGCRPGNLRVYIGRILLKWLLLYDTNICEIELKDSKTTLSCNCFSIKSSLSPRKLSNSVIWSCSSESLVYSTRIKSLHWSVCSNTPDLLQGPLRSIHTLLFNPFILNFLGRVKLRVLFGLESQQLLLTSVGVFVYRWAWQCSGL